MDLFKIPTPALLVDRTKLERNINQMVEKTQSQQVALRPHIKTHKCLNVATLQQDAGCQGITVSTLKEAEIFGKHGFTDIVYAVPIEPTKFPKFFAINNYISLKAVVDSTSAIARFNQEAVEKKQMVEVLVQVDMGYHRCGVNPSSPSSIEIVKRIIEASNLEFKGILTHAGNSYSCSSESCIKQVAEKEQDVMIEFSKKLTNEGEEFHPEIVSIGSTPTISLCDRIRPEITEVRPGNYVYYDYTQVKLGSCKITDCALTVLASVIGKFDGRIVIDAGATALSKDRGPTHIEPQNGYGKIFEDYQEGILDDRAVFRDLAQEHGKVSLDTGSPLNELTIGDKVRILPNHSCLTNNLFRKAQVLEGNNIVDEWDIHSGHL